MSRTNIEIDWAVAEDALPPGGRTPRDHAHLCLTAPFHRARPRLEIAQRGRRNGVTLWRLRWSIDLENHADGHASAEDYARWARQRLCGDLSNRARCRIRLASSERRTGATAAGAFAAS